MSTQPFATLAVPTLADAVDEALAAGLAGRAERCLWCGGSHVTVVSGDVWSGAVVVRCTTCGSELSGVVPCELRELREVSA